MEKNQEINQKENKNKIYMPKEIAYVLSLVLLSFAVAMATCASFGLTMIVVPAFLLSEKLGISFGQGEYIVQALLLVIFCIVVKKVKIKFLFTFITGVLYGLLLDFWRLVIPHFNPNITPYGSLPLGLNIVYFIGSIILTSIAISLEYRTYLYPQTYDFFVKEVANRYKKINRDIFKICFDVFFFVLSILMSLIMFNEIKGIGIGTIILVVVNGVSISLMDKLIGKIFFFKPLFPKIQEWMEITKDK